MQVRPVGEGDLCQLVAVHIDAFPDSFLTKLGGRFLRRYYANILRYDGHIFYAVESSGALVGFAAGFFSPSDFYRSLRGDRVGLCFSASSAWIRNPRLLLQMLRRQGRRGSATYGESRAAAELSSLAVSRIGEGQGIGRALLRAFIAHAELRGGKCVYLTTDAKDNDRVERFYSRNGFIPVRRFEVDRGRLMCEYARYLDPAAEIQLRGDRT